LPSRFCATRSISSDIYSFSPTTINRERSFRQLNALTSIKRFCNAAYSRKLICLDCGNSFNIVNYKIIRTTMIRSRSVGNGKSRWCRLEATSLTRKRRHASMPSAAHQTSAFDFCIREQVVGHRLFPVTGFLRDLHLTRQLLVAHCNQPDEPEINCAKAPKRLIGKRNSRPMC